MKKQIYYILFIVFSLLLLAGCGKKYEIQEKNSLTIEEGVLSVGANLDYYPMEYYDGNGDTAGFDMEMAQALADEMGLELKVYNVAWDAIFKQLEKNQYDIIISGVSYTEERSKQYLLSDCYIKNGISLIVAKEADINSISDFSEMEIGVQLATTSDYEMQNFTKTNGCNLSQYEKIENAFSALERGDIDAVCSDTLVGSYYVSNNNGFKIIEYNNEIEPMCMCMPNGNNELQAKVNEALGRLRDKGILSDISIKYFGVDLTDISK